MPEISLPPPVPQLLATGMIVATASGCSDTTIVEAPDRDGDQNSFVDDAGDFDYEGTPFTLSEATSRAIPEDLECQDEANLEQCDNVNAELEAVREVWRGHIEDECEPGVEVTFDGIVDGDFDSQCQMTFYGWDTVEDSLHVHSGTIGLPGVLAAADMYNRVDEDSYGRDPFKSGSESDSGGVEDAFIRIGFSEDNNGGDFDPHVEMSFEPCDNGPESPMCVFGGDVPFFLDESSSDFEVVSSWVSLARRDQVILSGHVIENATADPIEGAGTGSLLYVATTRLTTD